MGPLLLSRLMDLNPTQEGVLNIAFKLADEEKLLLLDLKDLQALLADMAERAQEISGRYGNVTKASVGAIQRQLLVLEQQGGEGFFGEPALEIADLMRTTTDGRGIVNVLAADRLMQSPRLYATFLLWLLSELFEELPEVGDPEKPRLVFFFDEAHLLFDEAPKALVEKVEQVVKLIRSKGVGVYFVTQNPLDIPESVLAQLGNRVQHALRAYTPREQKAVDDGGGDVPAQSRLDVGEAITELGVGEALVSTLGDGGVPSMVQRTLIRPPSSRLGPIRRRSARRCIQASPVAGKYDTPLDRESAYEMLTRARRSGGEPAKPRGAARRSRPRGAGARRSGTGLRRTLATFSAAAARAARTARSVAEAAVKSVVRSVGSSARTRAGARHSRFIEAVGRWHDTTRFWPASTRISTAAWSGFSRCSASSRSPPIRTTRRIAARPRNGARATLSEIGIAATVRDTIGHPMVVGHYRGARRGRAASSSSTAITTCSRSIRCRSGSAIRSTRRSSR